MRSANRSDFRPVLRALLKATPVAMLVCGVLAAPAPAALETVIQDDPGLLYRSDEQVTANAQRMKQLGVDRVRITASWSALTRDAASDTKPAGFDATNPAAYEQARWAQLDRAIQAINAAGMKVLIDIGFWAPHWATSDPPGPRARTDIDPAAFADFSVAVARRYSGGFTPTPDAGPPPPPSEDQTVLDQIFKPLTGSQAPVQLPVAQAAQAGALPAVDEFVLWNEPNIPAFILPQWGGSGGVTPASPAQYRAMIQAAYPAVKGARRNAKVLIGNTSSTGGNRGSGPVAPLEFLQRLACVNAKYQPIKANDCAGFKKVPGDGWSHHPYSQNEKPTRKSDPKKEKGDLRLADTPLLANALNKLVRLNRISAANRSIFLTEFGYETSKIRGRPTISKVTQARWLTWAESIAERTKQVKSFPQFLLRDQPPAAGVDTGSVGRPGGEFYSGLLTADGKDKPAAKTFRAGIFAQRVKAAKGKKTAPKTSIYGRLRLGSGAKALKIQRRVGKGKWTTIIRLKVDGRASFRRSTAFRAKARYRLVYPDGGRSHASLDVPTTPVS